MATPEIIFAICTVPFTDPCVKVPDNAKFVNLLKPYGIVDHVNTVLPDIVLTVVGAGNDNVKSKPY